MDAQRKRDKKKRSAADGDAGAKRAEQKRNTAQAGGAEDDREALTKMHKLEKTITEKSQLNAISELMQACKATPTVTYNAIRALQRVFTHLTDKGVLNLSLDDDEQAGPKPAKGSSTNTGAMGQFKSFLQALLALLTHRHDQVKTLALKVLMESLHKKTTTYNRANNENTFPFSHFSALVEYAIKESNGVETPLFNLFLTKYFIKYDDVRYHTMKVIRTLCEQQKQGLQANLTKEAPNVNGLAVTSIYLLLQKIKMPASDKDISSFWIPLNESTVPQPSKHKPSKKLSKKAKKKRSQHDARVKKRVGGLAVKFVAGHRKVFEECYIAFLQLPLTLPIYKDVLRRMDAQILPYMVTPIRMIDFLKDSYDVGGVVSILALHGLFVLITKHNLDYPDFYKKLYSLFQPNIFHVKYRAKFFSLATTFLKSSHLPAYLVAAFVKRMARLALHAPPSGALFVIAFSYNMLKRHPQCQILLHHADDSAPGGSLLPSVDARKPTGSKNQNAEPVLLLAPELTSATTQPAPTDSVLMLDSTDAQRKRKRDEEAGVGEATEEPKIEPTNDAEENGAQIADGQHKKRRRRRGGRGGSDKQEDNEDETQTSSGDSSAATKGKEKRAVPTEEDDIALGNYLRSGTVGSDPFVFEELDPQKCKVMSSSLWELKALQHHYVPQVSKLAKIFDEPPVKQPFDLDDFIDESYLSLFEAHVKRKTKSTALAYQAQETLFSISDCFQSVWSFPAPSAPSATTSDA